MHKSARRKRQRNVIFPCYIYPFNYPPNNSALIVFPPPNFHLYSALGLINPFPCYTYKIYIEHIPLAKANSVFDAFIFSDPEVLAQPDSDFRSVFLQWVRT